MTVKTNLINLFLITLLFSSCNKSSRDSGIIKADFKLFSQQADKVVITMEKNLVNGDSIEIKDTILLNNGIFQYKYTLKQPKRINLKLLKNNIEIGNVGFKDKELNKTSVFANPIIGNETVTIKAELKNLNKKTFVAQIEGANQNRMFQKAFTVKKVTIDLVEKNSSNFSLLWNLREFSNNYTSYELEMLSSKFSAEIRKSPSFKVFTRIILEKKNLEKFGYSKNFNWVDINNKSYNFEKAKNGKNKILLIFWASWCIPCRKEIPNLKKFYKKYNERISMVSLSIDEDYNRWKNAVEDEKMPWLNLSGLPKSKNSIFLTYDIHAVPTLILLDENGKVIERNTNDLDKIIDIIEK